jgi:hypothetical protein
MIKVIGQKAIATALLAEYGHVPRPSQSQIGDVINELERFTSELICYEQKSEIINNN